MQVIPIASNSIESLLPTIDKILWELISHEYDKKCRAEGVAVVDDVFFEEKTTWKNPVHLFKK